ncbi:hypothetical protein PS687_05709 [Pseudomonas fluorescens]|nr:hypothetical protein PS687_05709 [Pseudomonas fluorescens]
MWISQNTAAFEHFINMIMCMTKNPEIRLLN